MTSARDATTAPQPVAEPTRETLDRWLDAALEDSFPASDPPAHARHD